MSEEKRDQNVQAGATPELIARLRRGCHRSLEYVTWGEETLALFVTIEQQREQIAALSAFVGSFTPPTIQALQAKCTALEKERDRLAQKNLDCREVLVTLFINEGNTEEIARLSVQEVLGEASCPN